MAQARGDRAKSTLAAPESTRSASTAAIWDERATIHARDTTGDYMLDRFRAGEDALHAIEAAELGDIRAGASCICNAISGATRCASRGAARWRPAGFLGVALDVARRLAAETGLQARFVEGTVDEAPRLTPGPFDLVFTTWGTIVWLPDVRAWANAIAPVLAPGANSISPTHIRASWLLGGRGRPTGPDVRFPDAGRPTAGDGRRRPPIRRPDHHDPPVVPAVDPFALGDFRRPDRRRPDDHDVSRARSSAVAWPAGPCRRRATDCGGCPTAIRACRCLFRCGRQRRSECSQATRPHPASSSLTASSRSNR